MKNKPKKYGTDWDSNPESPAWLTAGILATATLLIGVYMVLFIIKSRTRK